MRAGLLDKCLGVDEVLEEEKLYFNTETHSAGDWELRFQTSRMAKLGAGLSLKARSAAGLQAAVNVRDYAKTPAKRFRAGEPVDLSPSWVDVESKGMGFGNIKVWDPLSEQDVVNRIALNNFELLKKETIRAATNWSDAVGQIRESTQQLISTQAQTDIQVGKPGTFGASVGVVNAFDGLRHLMELVEGNEAKFDKMEYGDLVALVGRVDQAVVHLSASDTWSMETTELRAMIGQTRENLIQLRDKAVAPLVGM
jgi:hypothetical protein